MAFLARAMAGATRAYFEVSYRLLTGSPEGLGFLRLTALLPGVPAHGYTTEDDLDALVRFAGADRSGPLLDLGCGIGGISLEIHRRTGATITGVDISGQAIRTAGARAASAGAHEHVSFVRCSIQQAPRTGATDAYALDSLMFAPIDADILNGIRDALDGRPRLFTTVLAVGLSSRDPIASLADGIGLTVAMSEDVTGALLVRSMWRRRVARHMLGRDRRSLRGRLAMTLVIVEEALVQRQVRSGRLRRWRTVVDLGVPGSPYT